MKADRRTEYVSELRGIAYDLRRWAPPSPHCNVAASSLERIAWEMEQSATLIDGET